METATLSNGMNVIIIPDHRAPVVLHSVWFRAGAVDEETGQTGIAHMLEHLMFKGTKTLPNKAREQLIQRNGAQENAFTSRDYTAYYQKVAKDRLPLMMEQEADRMINLTLTEEDFQPERSVVLEERQLRTESKPVSRFYEELVQAHYGAHPYSNPVIGWRADIEAYTRDKAIAWYNTHYAPNNATLILHGDITLAEAMPLVEQYYAPLKPANTPNRVTEEQPLRAEPILFDKVDAEVQVPVWLKLWRTPTLQAKPAGTFGDNTDAFALEVLADILGGSQTSRLYQALVVEQEMADSANASFDEVGAGEGSFDVSVQPKAGKSLTHIEDAVNVVLAEIIENGVTETELTRSKKALKSADIYARDDGFNVVYRLGLMLMAGGTVEDFKTYPSALQTVTAADIQRVAKTYLNATHYTRARLVASQELLVN